MFPKQTLSLLASCLVLTSIFAFQPTPIQQFLSMPSNSGNLGSLLWYIGDDIVAFYQLKTDDLTQGYLKMTPATSQAEKILVDTVSSCKGDDASLLDASYYHPSISTFVYYCIANNSLLTINQNYTVQDAILLSTSQKFSDVILGHNEQGYVYILGLPDLLSLPANSPTELILVDLKTKAVENHVIFNKGSDSQVLVTGYAFDSGVAYVQTKELIGNDHLVKISKIILQGNDYELTPFGNFTYEKGRPEYSFYNRLCVVDGYVFTNDNHSLVIFDKNGNLFQSQQTLVNFLPVMKDLMSFERILVPMTGAQIGGSAFYASLSMGMPGVAFSLQNGKMASRVIDESSDGFLIAIGSKDLIMGMDYYSFNIRDAKTNATLYVSFRNYDDIMMSESHLGVLTLGSVNIFDRKNLQLPQRILSATYTWLDKTTNLIVTFPFSPYDDCQVTYTDLETFKARNGPMIPNAACVAIKHVNLTDLARPFFVTNPAERNHYFISPSTYGTILWKCPNYQATEGIVVPSEDPEAFTYVWNQIDSPNVINIDSYKFDKMAKTFTLRGSFPLTTNQTQAELTKYYKIGSSKVLLAHAKNVTVVDLAAKTFKIYDVPAVYDSPKGVGVLYDKSNTPYLALAEVKDFGETTTSPQLLDFSSGVRTMPGVISGLTRTAMVVGNCTYLLSDEFDDTMKVIRLYDICAQGDEGVEKIDF